MSFLNKIIPSLNTTPELISIHIPKTAGTSFAEILKDAYGSDNVGSLHIQHVEGQQLPRVTYLDKPCENSVFSFKRKVLHGHFSHQRIAEIIKPPAGTSVITWLRHPVSRVVSAYHYAEQIFRNELSMIHPRLNILNSLKRSLMQYAYSKENRNLYTHLLAGVQLEDLRFVGIVEHFEEDMADLSKLLGWKNYQLPHLNRTAKRAPLADFKYDAIRLWNQADMELYEQALALRKRRKAP